MEGFRQVWAAVWGYERALSARWWPELRKSLAEHVWKRLVGVLVAAVGAAMLGKSLDGAAGAILGLILLTAGLLLWSRTTAQARIHAEQEAKIQGLQPRPANQPQVLLRATLDHGNKNRGDVYIVPHARVADKVESGKAEVISAESALRWLVGTIDRLEALIVDVAASPPSGNWGYYPHGTALRQHWASALDELRRDLGAFEAVVPEAARGTVAAPRMWLDQLKDETAGEGRLYQYRDKVRRLKEWAQPLRLTLEAEDQPPPTESAPDPPSSPGSSE